MTSTVPAPTAGVPAFAPTLREVQRFLDAGRDPVSR